MAKPNKTVETTADVAAYLAALPDERQRADAAALAATMARLSGEPAKLWGPSIVGFGSYHYRYESGREGDSLRIGFAARKGTLVLYGIDGVPDGEPLKRLGKHRTGKGCLYIARLADVDAGVLDEIIAASIERSRETHPA